MKLDELRKYSLKYLQLLGFTYGSTISIGQGNVGKIKSFSWTSNDDDKKWNFLDIFQPKNWGKHYDYSILVNLDTFTCFDSSATLFYLNSKKINPKIKLIQANHDIEYVKEDSYTRFVYYKGYLIGDITDIATGFEMRMAATFYSEPLLFKDDIDNLKSPVICDWFEDSWAKECFLEHFEQKLAYQCPKILEKLKNKIGIWDSLIKNVS